MFQLDAVVDALRALPDFPGMSVSDVRGFGSHMAHPPHKGERTEVEPFERKTRIEIACNGGQLEAIVEALRAAAHTGHPGDGKIVVMALYEAVRVRTGERGRDALVSSTEVRPAGSTNEP